jgi:hypothetical protein
LSINGATKLLTSRDRYRSTIAPKGRNDDFIEGKHSFRVFNPLLTGIHPDARSYRLESRRAKGILMHLPSILQGDSLSRVLQGAASQRMTFLSAALLTTLLALSGGARAQDSSKIVPANAQAKQYGSGWECKPGFRRDGAACAAIKLPANAYLSDDTFGPGWACKREYKADGNSCVAVKLPQNAYLAGSTFSADWECERGFRKAGVACVLVTVPKNGYLSDSSQSRGWDCERGFRATADACVAVKVPQNGYLSDATYGSGWQCERGFRQSEQACVSIEVPRNAYLEASGKDWNCDRPFWRQRDECVVPR